MHGTLPELSSPGTVSELSSLGTVSELTPHGMSELSSQVTISELSTGKLSGVSMPGKLSGVSIPGQLLEVSPRRIMILRRRLQRGPGWVWLVLVPLCVFILCLLCEMRLLLPCGDNTTLLLDEELQRQLTPLSPAPFVEHSDTSSPAQLQRLEQQVTSSYLRVQLMLAAASGSLKESGDPLLVDVGTLSDLRTFQPLLTPREKAHLLYTFQLFSAACRTNKLSFFLLGNSLLGSLRHHGLVPWSDVSITVGMDAAEADRIRGLLDRVEGTRLMWSNPYSWTLRLEDVRPDPPHLQRLTFVRIQLYHQNQTHVWADAWANKRLFTAPRDRVFPLSVRPFEGWLTFAPCDPVAVLPPGEVEVCRAVVEDLEEMMFRDAGTVSCDILRRVFPFVGRQLAVTASSRLEQVMVNRTLLSSVLVDTACTPDRRWLSFLDWS